MAPSPKQRAQGEDPSCDGRLAGVRLDRLAEIAYATGFKILRDPDEAKDIAQETMTRLFTWVSKHGAPEVPQAWVSTVAANLVRNHVRDRSRHSCTPLPDEASIGTVDVGSGLLDELRLVLGYAELPLRQRQVLDHLYGADLHVSDVAERLGISEHSVRTHRYRALRALRKRHEAGSGSEMA